MKRIFTLLSMFLLAGSILGQSVIIGTGTSTTDGSTIDPVERFYNYTHCQIIYTAAELSAVGMPAGATITALGFSISESAVSLVNYTISMGTTSQSTAQPYISALTVVKPAFTYNPVVQAAGSFDMIPFTTAFLWNGTSNIVINTCTGSNGFASPYGGLRYTASTSGMITYVRTDGSNNCANTSLSSTTYRPNIKFNYTPPPPCSGTPAPGNTVASANPACIGASFSLTLQNPTSGSGVLYQWQFSLNGTVWTNVSNWMPSYTTSQTVATYYRCLVTCSGNTGTSNPLLVMMNPVYNCYCASTATSTADEDIFNVTVGSINNSSTCATLAPGPGSVQNMYSNYYFDITPVSIQRTATQSFSVQIGTCGGSYNNSTKIFIDYNQNASFTDPGEEVYVSASSTSGPHTESGSFIVPLGATTGTTRMRVINVETSTPSSITSCGTYSWGETEDYAVTLFDGPNSTTNNASLVTGMTATLNGTISANAASTTVTFEWGTMATPPFNNTFTLPAPVTGQSVAVNTPISGLQPNTTYYFRVLGTNSAGTSSGTVLSFTTSMMAPAIVTNNATTVGSSFATLNGIATAYNSATTVSFEYGTIAGGPYPNTVPGIPAIIGGNNATDFYAALTGLVINTTYYFRAKGVNGAGNTYGPEKNFYTMCVVPPTPGSITGTANVCKNSTGYVYSVSQVPYGFYYNWIFPTGFTISSYPHSNSVIVDVSNTAVSGTISVIAVSDCGGSSSASAKSVTVNNLPVPTVSSGPTAVCQSVFNTYSTQSGMTDYQWNASPDGTITPTSTPDIVTISWPTAGSKTVGVIYTNPATGCTAAAPGALTVLVNSAPEPVITGSDNMCVNSGWYNYSTETGMTNYIWTISPGGTITYGQGTAIIEVTWNVPGAQYVTVNYNDATNCSAMNSTVFDVTVDGLPGNAGTVTGTSSVCYNSTNVAYSVAPITNTVYYVWTLPIGAIIASGAGTNSITVDFTNALPGNITVYGNSLCGNGTVSPPFPVTIIPQPGAAGTILGSASVCEGQTGVSYLIPPVTGANGYRWIVPTGATIASGDNTPNITVDFAIGAESGVITVYGINICSDGAPSPEFNVTVGKKPEAPVITLSGVTLTSSITDGNQWYYNGAPITGATQQTLTCLYDGWYWDAVTAQECSSDTSNNIYVSVTGIGEPADSKFFVYPVPNDGRFTIKMSAPKTEAYDVDVYNSIGVSIYSKKDVPVDKQTELTIDMRPVPTGIYTIILRNSENRILRKIIVNK